MTSLSKLVVQDVTLMAIITNTKSTFASSSFGMKQNNPIKKKKKKFNYINPELFGFIMY